MSNLHNILSLQCDAIRWEQFSGDVVLDSVNMAFRDEEAFLTKYMKSTKFWNFFMKISNCKIN